MTGSGFGNELPSTRDIPGSISMSDVLALPAQQRRVMIWMIRQNRITLADAAQRLECSEAEAQDVLDTLVEQGYVQVIALAEAGDAETPLLYRAQTIRRQSGTGVELEDMVAPAPLAVILSGMGNGTFAPGEVAELSVTVINKGDESAIIDIFLDNLPTALYSWVSSTQERLALGSAQSGEAIFQFQVPADALPAQYTYNLVVDAPQHYPNSPPLSFEQAFQVLPAIEAFSQASDPTFFLVPPTRAASPASLAPGDILELQVWVQNQGDRVDRFRLRCTDLPSQWVTISYPQGFQQIGLTLTEQFLDLNPGEQGTILVLITIPLDTLAGSYIGTLQLQSENQPNLAMLDLVYLTVQPVYQVTFSFRALVSRVQDEPGVFMVQASNQGNIARHLQFQALALDGGDLCTYTLEPPQLHLQPRQTQTVRLLVQPNQPRKRPWLGGGRVLNFAVEVQDVERHPLPEVPMQGFVLWDARPWWQLLPLVLLGLGALATLIWLIWWSFLRPPVAPRVVRLLPSDLEYAVANDEAVRLDFQVSDPWRVQSLELVGQSPEGTITSNPVSYELSRGLPPELEPFCNLTRQFLTCRNVLTDARQPGEYLFTLTVFPKPGRGRVPPHSLTTPPVVVAPYPQPEILTFEATQVVYPEAPPPPPAENGETPAATKPEETDPGAIALDDPTSPYGIRLNWAIAHPERIAALQLVGRDPDGNVLLPPVTLDLQDGLPLALEPFCTLDVQLICENVQTGFRQAGRYIFELTVIPLDDPPPTPISQTTPPIRIEARSPQILEFWVNGEPMQPTYIVPVDQDQPMPQFVISWRVEANPGTTISLLPVPGNVEPQGSLPVPLSPEPSSTVISLQVTNSAGVQVTRSFTLRTFDPTPGEAGAEAAGAAAGGDGAGAEAGAAGSEDTLTTPRPSLPGRLAPSELPPQF